MDVLNTFGLTKDTDLQHFYNKNMLSDGARKLVHEVFAKMCEDMPQKKGDYCKWHRYAVPTAATAEIVEAVNPDPTTVTRTEVTAQIKQYGAYTAYSDKVDLMDVDPTLTSLGRVMGTHGQVSMDAVARDIFQGGTSVYYANNVAGRSSIITELSNDDLDAIDRAMQNDRAEYLTEITSASQNYGTESVDEAFYVIGHTDLKKDLPGLTGWIPRKDYADPKVAHPFEVGAVGNFRFVLTPEAKIHADGGGSAVTNTLKFTTANTACDVYPLLIVGKDAIGKVPLSGKGFENVNKDLGSAGAADPLSLYGTVGWKSLMAYVILNESWLYRYEIGVSR